jgi:excisionase family DNA binding protein
VKPLIEPPPLRLNLSVDDAASALGVSPRTVRKLIARRELRAHHIGRRVLLSVDALYAFVRAREAEASA